MGCCESKEKLPEYGKGHPELYYKGVDAVHEGRFTVSEIYFQQAINNHPGRTWWKELIAAMTGKDKKKKDEFAEALEAADHVDENAELGEAEKAFAEVMKAQKEGTEEKDKITRIELPVDRRLEDIVDFIRLISDISHEYLTTSAGGSKARYIAALYNGTICLHLQLFMHVFQMMRDQQDADIRIKTGDPSIKSYKIYVWSKSYREIEEEHQNAKDKKKKKKRDQGLETELGLIFILELLHMAMRYYWFSAVFNYCLLIYRMSQGLSKDKDGKKRAAIFANIFENCSQAEACIVGVAKEHALHYLGQSALSFLTVTADAQKQLNVVDFHSGDDQSSSQQHSSNKDKQSTRYYASLLGSSGGSSAEQRSLVGLSREFNPGIPNTLALPNVLPARLILQDMVLKENCARIKGPCQRYTLYYINWAFSLDYDFIPGNSKFFFDHALNPNAQFTPADFKEATTPSSEVHTVKMPEQTQVAGEEALDSEAQIKRVRASEAFPEFDYHPHVNEDVNKKDMHTVDAMGYEELAFLAKVIFCIKIRMGEMAGADPAAAAKRRTNFNYFIASLFGRNTFEAAITEQITRDMKNVYASDAAA